jgi:hypothetical protein
VLKFKKKSVTKRLNVGKVFKSKKQRQFRRNNYYITEQMTEESWFDLQEKQKIDILCIET